MWWTFLYLFIKSQSHESIFLQVPRPLWRCHILPIFPVELPGQGSRRIPAWNLQRLQNSASFWGLWSGGDARLQSRLFDNLSIGFLAFCGKELPGAITSRDNTMHIRFESDYLENRQGFLATWTEVPPPNLIRGRSQGEFKTPNYPKKYPKHTRIVQTFTIPDGAKVEFKVVDFETGERHDHFCINSPNWKTNRPSPDSQVKPGA